MAEDQGVNGTIWNKEANAILAKFNWESIGDIDMDIIGDDDKLYGIDSLIKLETPLSSLPSLIVLEAKRYETTSFNARLLQGWVDRLDKKLTKLKFSEKLKEKFPIVDDCAKINTAIIAIWFHDTDNYKTIAPVFKEALQNVNISNRSKTGGYNRIFVIDNSIILKLCSLNIAIESFNKEKNTKIDFLYPSVLNKGRATVRQNILSPEYILSKVILAEAKTDKGERENIVFYFGEVKLNAIKLLRDQLSQYSLIDTDRSLFLYLYNADIEDRKIQPEIKKIFSDVERGFTIKIMDQLNNLPGEIKTIGYE